jgi:hypothetical protein
MCAVHRRIYKQVEQIILDSIPMWQLAQIQAGVVVGHVGAVRLAPRLTAVRLCTRRRFVSQADFHATM